MRSHSREPAARARRPSSHHESASDHRVAHVCGGPAAGEVVDDVGGAERRHRLVVEHHEIRAAAGHDARGPSVAEELTGELLPRGHAHAGLARQPVARLGVPQEVRARLGEQIVVEAVGTERHARSRRAAQHSPAPYAMFEVTHQRHRDAVSRGPCLAVRPATS